MSVSKSSSRIRSSPSGNSPAGSKSSPHSLRGPHFQPIRGRAQATPFSRLRLTAPDEPLPPDEWANFLTHGLGFLLTIPAAWWMLQRLGTLPSQFALATQVYCFTLVGLYAASTLSHTFPRGKARRFFRTVDQIFIFLLIAGSFTPFAVTYHPGGWASPLLVLEWSLAWLGVCLCLFYKNLPQKVRLLYGVNGWLPAFFLPAMIPNAPLQMILLLVAGGLMYSFGTIFLLNDRRVKHFHSLWHLSTIGGSACHFFAVALMLP